jgi:hypothetical protein
MADRTASGWHWQDKAAGGGLMDEQHPIRRSGVGWHDMRLDGLTDLLSRAHGASVLDIGCNRGHVGYEFAVSGARLVHGCDIYGPGIQVARHWFTEMPHTESKFEVVDLQLGPVALTAAFGPEGYDIVLYLGTHHKIARLMDATQLRELVVHLGSRSLKYFAWSGYYEHLDFMDDAMKEAALERIHTTELTMRGRPAAIWRR